MLTLAYYQEEMNQRNPRHDGRNHSKSNFETAAQQEAVILFISSYLNHSNQ